MCQKLVVMAVATDCEECNKKALVCLREVGNEWSTGNCVTEDSSVCFFAEKRDGQTVYERDRR